MPLVRSSLLALTALVGACSQEIVVVQCDAHATGADGAVPPADAATDAGRGDSSTLDGQVAADAADASDAGNADGGAGDGGVDPCAGGSYCLRGLVADKPRANVREVVTLTPTIENPGGVTLAFSVRPLEITSTRLPNRPALRLADIQLELTVQPDGTATFRVVEVPPWFIATTFHLRVYASGPSGPEVFAETDVHIRGNTVLSISASEGFNVFAVASDGRPARAVTAGSTKGQLVRGAASSPRALLMSQSGTLLVLDTGPTPRRILRFELTGENVQIGELATVDGQAAALFSETNTSFFMLAETADGHIIATDYDSSRQPRSRIVVWNADGTFARFITPLDTSLVWGGAGVRANGEILAMVRDGSTSRVMRLDLQSGMELAPPLADTLQSNGRAVLGIAGGDAYAGVDGAVMLVRPGGVKIRISTLPTQTFDYWQILAPYDQGRILASRDTSSDSTNVAIIADRDFVDWLRPTGVSGVSGSVYGMAYLE